MMTLGNQNRNIKRRQGNDSLTDQRLDKDGLFSLSEESP